jgi:hypothetical protein
MNIKTNKNIEVGQVFIHDKTLYICSIKQENQAILEEIDWDEFFVSRAIPLDELYD